MIAGCWVLAALPLLDLLRRLGLIDRVPVPKLPEFQKVVRSLGDTLLGGPLFGTWPYLPFCVGVVLLFARERGRRRNRLDLTRRWGVFGSYVVALLGLTTFGFIMALVAMGCAALFHTLPIEHQPAITGFLADAGAAYIYYGPQDDGYIAWGALVAASSVTMLLACVPLHDALRSSGPRWAAFAVIAPLAAAAVAQLPGAVLAGTDHPLQDHWFAPPYYFEPDVSLQLPAAVVHLSVWGVSSYAHATVEAAKWLAILAAAVWLTIAQVAAWRTKQEQVR